MFLRVFDTLCVRRGNRAGVTVLDWLEARLQGDLVAILELACRSSYSILGLENTPLMFDADCFRILHAAHRLAPDKRVQVPQEFSPRANAENENPLFAQ